MATDAPLEEFEAKHQELRREAWEAYQARKKKERLSQFPTTRIPITALAAFCIGTVSGAINGSKVAGLRFRAENAHRLPTSQKGWYYYHKSKNYNATWEAIKTGPKLGARMAFWAASFLLLEESLDHLRGDPYGRDCISTVLAAMTTSGAWSVWKRFPAATAARTMKSGFRIGLAYGLAQDAVSLMVGRPVGYVEFTKEVFGKRTAEQDDTLKANQ